jgi:hypothetical protein
MVDLGSEKEGQDVGTEEGVRQTERDPKEMTDRDLEDVSGGRTSVVPDIVKTPAPGGPVPLPYPNST